MAQQHYYDIRTDTRTTYVLKLIPVECIYRKSILMLYICKIKNHKEIILEPPGKFNEDGSFIGKYSNSRPNNAARKSCSDPDTSRFAESYVSGPRLSSDLKAFHSRTSRCRAPRHRQRLLTARTSHYNASQHLRAQVEFNFIVKTAPRRGGRGAPKGRRMYPLLYSQSLKGPSP